jgi:hypothetical protein
MTFDSFNAVTAKRAYTYRRNPVHDGSFMILKQMDGETPYLPIGDYTVLDREESPLLTERKVMNLVSLMNDDEGDLIDLGAETNSRLLYHRASTDQPDKTRIIFYALHDKGVSKENAILTLEEGLEDDADIQ